MRSALRTPMIAAALASLALASCAESGQEGADAPEAPPAGQAQDRTSTERGVPLTPGGDNSIQEFGVEGGVATREALAPLAAAHVNAHARGRWQRICSQLSAATIGEIEQFTAQAGSASCAEALAKLSPRPSASARSLRGGIELSSVREDGEAAFAIFRVRDGSFYYLPLSREGGEWKVRSVGAVPLIR